MPLIVLSPTIYGFEQIQESHCARLPPGGGTTNLQNDNLHTEKAKYPFEKKASFLNSGLRRVSEKFQCDFNGLN